MARQQLLVHLMHERLQLLRPLLALSEAVLVEEPVFEDQTVKDLLAHIAAWDQVHVQRLRRVLAGEVQLIESLEPDEQNEMVLLERRDWSLHQAIDAFTNSRRDYLALLEQLPDDVFRQPLTLPWGGTATVEMWAQWRVDHDRDHTADLRAWRERNQFERGVGPVALMLAALEASRGEMLALIGLVPEGERDSRPLMGDWTLRDIVGHVADWESFAIECLDAGRILNMGYGGQVLSRNDAYAARRLQQPWAQAFADFRRMRQELVQRLEPLDRQQLAEVLEDEGSWGASRTRYQWGIDYVAHEQEHTEELRQQLLRPANRPDTP
jgi:hypothetical protein